MGGWVGWLVDGVGGWMDGWMHGRTDKEEKDSDRCTLANSLSLSLGASQGVQCWDLGLPFWL